MQLFSLRAGPKQPAHAAAALAALTTIVALVLTACVLPIAGVRLGLPGLPAAGTSALAPAVPAPAVAPVSPYGAAQHETRRVLGHVDAIAGTVGERVSGGAGETRAVEYIAAQFGALGYHVEVMSFIFDDEYLLPGSVGVDGATVQGLTIGGSASGQVTAPAVHVGLGNAEGFAGKQVRGKIAVADRSAPLLYDAIMNARAAGAAALVVVNAGQGLIGGWFSPPEPLLVVAVGGAAGERLQAAAEAGREVTVEATGASRRESVNVFARATPGTRCAVLVGGHHDTVPASPGANDNASGIGTTLELARAFAAAGRPEGLCFATFGAEESWWHGSQALAARLKEEDALPQLMVNLDVTGIGDSVEVIGTPGVAHLALALAQELNIATTGPRDPATVGSDHRNFMKVGVPVLFFTSGHFATVHAATDVAADIEPASLQRVGDLAFATITHILQQRQQGDPAAQ